MHVIYSKVSYDSKMKASNSLMSRKIGPPNFLFLVTIKVSSFNQPRQKEKDILGSANKPNIYMFRFKIVLVDLTIA